MTQSNVAGMSYGARSRRCGNSFNLSDNPYTEQAQTISMYSTINCLRKAEENI